MSEIVPVAVHAHCAGELDATLDFLKQTRDKLRELRLAHVGENWVRAIDVNGDACEIKGFGYRDAEIIPVLNALNAVFNKDTIHKPISLPTRNSKPASVAAGRKTA